MNDAPDRDVTVFTEALELPVGERGAYLERACGGDIELRRRVEALLAGHDDVGDFLEDSAPKTSLQARLGTSAGEKPGDRVGRYKLLRQIGEGGCGVVFMAEQEQPVRRRVALKIIKPGMDTKSVMARFEAEGQALALMDHPNIAKIFDAGATESGRPYFVMELVRGVKITEYCGSGRKTQPGKCWPKEMPWRQAFYLRVKPRIWENHGWPGSLRGFHWMRPPRLSNRDRHLGVSRTGPREKMTIKRTTACMVGSTRKRSIRRRFPN
jgi:hypothetical protein